MKESFFSVFLKAVFVVLLSVVIGMSYNSFSGKGIALVGSWSNKMTSDSLLVPPSYVEGVDPKAISLNDAMMYFQSREAVFVDARYKEEFDYGHIKGAINLPFEEFDKYYDLVKDKLPSDKILVIYCSGTDCEASLFLARLLRNLGYKNENIKVFFGGWEQWQKANLPTATGR
jgi:rhodanese-related sulfurtransferase